MKPPRQPGQYWNDMPCPIINHCLICEDIRLEANRKTSLLGFYGVAPNVRILIRDTNQPIRGLALMLLADRGEGTFNFSLRITGPNGIPLLPPYPPMEMVIQEREFFNSWCFALGPVVFPHFGRYTFTFEVDGRTHFETSFEVSQGRPQDFQ